MRFRSSELFKKSSQRTFKASRQNGSLFGEVKITNIEWVFLRKFSDQYGQTDDTLTYADGYNHVGQLTGFTRHGLGKFNGKSGHITAGRWMDDMNVTYATSMDSQGVQWYGTQKN